MYLGVNFSIGIEGGRELNKDYSFRWNGDLFDTLLGNQDRMANIMESTKTNWTDYDQGNFSNINEPEKVGGISSGTGGINFLDALNIAWSIIPTLFNVATAPLTLLFNFRIPVIIGLMIGIPYFLILILTLFAFIRGVGD
jgi:hypothetical protein